jgi:predicted tellurium resistance membrane protein TerC
MTGFEHLLTPDNITTFLTLTFLEIVLAGDNLVLIAILASRLPEGQRPMARRLGLLMAVVTRIALLFSLFWLSHLEAPITVADGVVITPRTLIFGLGGAFLVIKAVIEIFNIFAVGDSHPDSTGAKVVRGAFMMTLAQIALFDVIFSLDSVIAAIGIAQQVEIMVAAVLIATAVMFFLVNPISDFIDRNRIVKVLALNFLVYIGVLLMAEAAHYDLPRAELYTIFGFAVLVQALMLWIGGLRAPIRQMAMLLLTGVLAGGIALLANNEALARGQSPSAVLDEASRDAQSFWTTASDWVRKRTQ